MTDDVNCGYENKHTSRHPLICILTLCRCEIEDLIGLPEITDEMIKIIEYRKRENCNLVRNTDRHKKNN